MLFLEELKKLLPDNEKVIALVLFAHVFESLVTIENQGFGRAIGNKLSNCIQVLTRDAEQLFRHGALQGLILDAHQHQIK